MADLADLASYIWPDVAQGRPPSNPTGLDTRWGKAVLVYNKASNQLYPPKPLIIGNIANGVNTGGAAGFSNNPGQSTLKSVLDFGPVTPANFTLVIRFSRNSTGAGGTGKVSVLAAQSYPGSPGWEVSAGNSYTGALSNRFVAGGGSGSTTTFWIDGVKQNPANYYSDNDLVNGVTYTAVVRIANAVVTADGTQLFGYVGSGGPELTLDGYIDFAVIVPALVSDAEGLELSLNPGSVLNAQSLGSATVPAAGGGATLAATATAQSTATADLSHGITLAGAALSVASATAGMSHSVPLAATATATASASGNIALSVTLAASAVAQAVAAAALTVSGGSTLAANAAAVASAGATLALAVNLSASAIAQAVASAELGGSATLAAAAIANAQATSALAVGKPLAAGAQGASASSASLWVQVPLSAAALAQAAAGASLNLTVTLAANALSNASASASLPGTVSLAAAGVSVATAGATLQIGGAIDPALNRMLTVRQMPRHWSHTQRHRTFVVVT